MKDMLFIVRMHYVGASHFVLFHKVLFREYKMYVAMQNRLSRT